MKNFLENLEMRTVIKDQPSMWSPVLSGIPQGSVLAPIMFAVYINDMVENVTSYASLFADDAKILRKVKDMEDCEELQRDLDKVCEWSNQWQMEFNFGKCTKMEFGKSNRRCIYK